MKYLHDIFLNKEYNSKFATEKNKNNVHVIQVRQSNYFCIPHILQVVVRLTVYFAIRLVINISTVYTIHGWLASTGR